ncbi:MAG: hypothetical protein WBA76_06315 [Phormidesmis sp.]
MSIIALLLTVIMAYWFTKTAEAFPEVLWGWTQLPGWLLWTLLLALLAWCVDD